MRYFKFVISNYKGIDQLVLNLDGKPASSIFTLVGLNESGKTTVLEALNHYYEELKLKDEPHLAHDAVDREKHRLIPKAFKSNFNGEIRVAGWIRLSPADIEEVKAELASLGLETTFVRPEVEIIVVNRFADSRFLEKRYTLNVEILTKEKGKRKSSTLQPSSKGWTPVWNWLRKNVQPIAYFPNFLFEFPDQINLEEYADEGDEQGYYRRFLQDILDYLDEQLNLQRHIIERIKRGEPQDTDALDSVLNKISACISQLVFNREFSVFSPAYKNKQVAIKLVKKLVRDKTTLNEVEGHALEIKLKDGNESYLIRERSLGFRWFFAFLLLTQFRVARQGGPQPIFLFDEPASNLHQTAQSRLLSALSRLVENSRSSVIYSTHSHHLINPDWLEALYIVRNSAIVYDDSVDEFTTAQTKITIEKYRKFVATHPDQESYYRPILDVLDYAPSNLEAVPDALMTEGKNDYYTLAYFEKVIFNRNSFAIIPGGGSGGLDAPISLYLGWARNFIVLLDSDEAGVKEKKRYIEKFGSVLNERVFLLSDIDPTWVGYDLEDLIDAQDRLSVCQIYDPDLQKPNKKVFNSVIQELLIKSRTHTFSSDTLANVERLLVYLRQSLENKTP